MHEPYTYLGCVIKIDSQIQYERAIITTKLWTFLQ